MKIKIICTEEEYIHHSEMEETMTSAMKSLVDLGLKGELQIIVPEKSEYGVPKDPDAVEKLLGSGKGAFESRQELLEEPEEAERKWMIEYNYEDECELSNEFEIFETEIEMLNRKAELEKENWEILRFGKAKKELQEVWVFVDAEEQK